MYFTLNMDNNQQRDNMFPFLRSQSTDSSFGLLQPRGILMAHSASLPSGSAASPGPSESSGLNFQRRTVEGARQFRLNISNVIREIQPLVEQVDISNFLNRPAQLDANTVGNNTTNSSTSNSFVINVEVPTTTANNVQQIGNNGNNMYAHNHLEHSPAIVNNGGAPHSANNPENVSTTERLQTVLEAQQCLSILQKYVPFIMILLAKGLYDHHQGILNLIVLFATFTHANSVVKKEATKRSRRNLSKLFCAFLYITAAIVFIHYIFEGEKLYLNLIFIRTYEKPLTVWDLLWIVGITDFILKLITVMFKIFLTLLPDKIIAFQKRGKIYLFMEALSQLYRSLATIQPWLYYLLESYQGPEKIVGVFLAAAYMVSKGADLMSRLKLLKTALFKLLQNVTVGSSPSKEQIQTAGEHCPICHDEYDSPVLLQCRHIFCESCVTTWFDREQTCPLCRAKIVDDPSWRDGSTTFFMQLF